MTECCVTSSSRSLLHRCVHSGAVPVQTTGCLRLNNEAHLLSFNVPCSSSVPGLLRSEFDVCELDDNLERSTFLSVELLEVGRCWHLVIVGIEWNWISADHLVDLFVCGRIVFREASIWRLAWLHQPDAHVIPIARYAPEVREIFTSVKRSECKLPQWDRCIDHLLDHSVEVLVLMWMEIVDI